MLTTTGAREVVLRRSTLAVYDHVYDLTYLSFPCWLPEQYFIHHYDYFNHFNHDHFNHYHDHHLHRNHHYHYYHHYYYQWLCCLPRCDWTGGNPACCFVLSSPLNILASWDLILIGNGRPHLICVVIRALVKVLMQGCINVLLIFS